MADDSDILSKVWYVGGFCLYTATLKNSSQVNQELCFLTQLRFTFQEYVDYYGGAGVQHIAMNTNDIIKTVMTNYDILNKFLHMYFKVE